MPHCIASAEPQSTDEFDLTTSLYRPSDGSERPTAGLQVTFQSVTVREDTHSIQDLLEQSHIWPNADAFGLLYALNPDMQTEGPLRPGDKLRVPTIDPLSETAKAASDDFWVKLRYDDRLIGEIVAARTRIAMLAAEIATLPAARLSNPEVTGGCVSDGAKDFSAIASALQRRDRPFDHEMLFQVRGDENVLSEIFQRTLAAGDLRMPVADEETICGVAKDLRLKEETFGTGRRAAVGITEKFPTVRVVVHTINVATGNQVSGLTVHYVPQALKDRPEYEKSLGGLTSPMTERIPEADYYFWATRQSAAVTEYKKCSVREEDNKPYVCDLPVRQ
jgi:hypothetical protein